MQQDIRVDLPELQTYLEAGCLSPNALKKYNQARQNGKSYAYIDGLDYAEIKRRFALKEQGFDVVDRIKHPIKPGIGQPRPVVNNVTSEQQSSSKLKFIPVLGVAAITFISVWLYGRNAKTDTTAIKKVKQTSSETISTIEDSIRKSNESYSLKSSIETELAGYGIQLLSIVDEDKNCLWIYVLNQGGNMSSISKRLCSTASSYGYKCVAIYDSNQNRLGKSSCN